MDSQMSSKVTGYPIEKTAELMQKVLEGIVFGTIREYEEWVHTQPVGMDEYGTFMNYAIRSRSGRVQFDISSSPDPNSVWSKVIRALATRDLDMLVDAAMEVTFTSTKTRR